MNRYKDEEVCFYRPPRLYMGKEVEKVAITVEELYKKESHEEIVLIAGEGGMENVVSWVHVVESIQISNFLEGQEIAFTTGVGIKSEEELLELVKYTYNRQASAMVLNVGPFIKSIPQVIRDFCNEVNFPLFEVPWEVHMAKIMRDFSMELLEADKFNMVLNSAVKNAIYYPNQEDLYIPSLESYHFLKEWSYCVSVVEICAREDDDGIDEVRKTMTKITDNTITRKYKNSVVFELENDIVIFMANYSPEEVEAAMTEFNNKIVSLLPEKFEYYFGVGECTKNIKCISKSFNKAKNALKMQRRKNNPNQLSFYGDLGLYKVLLDVQNKDTLEGYYREILEPVVIHDSMNGSEYMEFLRTYFWCKCNVQETADTLYMHRNSIRYNLNKIEEILGMDMSDINTKIKIAVALMIKELL